MKVTENKESVKEKKVPLKGVVKYVYKKVGKAVDDYNMIEEYDKILVAVSGGKDSLSLLKLLKMRKRRIPIHFDILACFVETNFIELDSSKVISYFERENIPYVVKDLELNIDRIDCFWCSWNRRKILFETANEYKCNKIALGHHLDDLVETILMNLFFFGEISCMKPKLSLFEEKLTIIRPLCYLEEKEIESFAKYLQLPYTGYRCKYGDESRRSLIKKIIREIEKNCPYTKKNIFRALKRIKKDYLL